MRRVLALVILIVMASVSACSVHSASSSGGKNGAFTLVWGKETDPAGINPLKAGDVHAWEIFSLVYEPLTRPNTDLTVGPGLARSWKQTSDTVWRFQLRSGVKFSNGRALTSDDVAGTWEAYQKVGLLDHLFPNVDKITAVDPLTFDIKLKAPMPDLPNRLEIFWVLPGKEWREGSFNPDKDLLGTGPFVSGPHVKGVSWTFTPNRHYWQQGLPKATSLQVRFISDDASRLAAVRTGQADFAITANPDVQKILAGDPRLKVRVQQTTDLYYLQLNPLWAKSKLRDVRVRQAIALAIDHKQIINTALGGTGEITAVTPRALPGACDPAGVLGAAGRAVAKAKSLLKAAGAGNLSFRLTVAPAFGALRAPQIAQVIQQNLSEIGVHMNIAVLDGGAWLKEITNGTFDATLNWFTGNGTVSHVIGYLDPESLPLFAKSISHDPTVIGQIRKAVSTPEGPGRKEAFAKACASVNELAYLVPLATKPTVIVYRADRIRPDLIQTEPAQMTFRDLARFTTAS
jgi:peptide/nickel transport system substrate-binding protein